MGNRERNRELYERAIANEPLAAEKPYWQRDIYLCSPSLGTGFTIRIETGDVAATVVKAVKVVAVENGCCGGVLGKLKVTFK